VQGDYRFAAWEVKDWKRYKKKIDDLRKQGYRKVDQYYSFQDFYQLYKRRKSKKVITVTMMCL
jgi:hypothetical protein